MKIVFGFIAAVAVIFLGYLILQIGKSSPEKEETAANNVSIVDGQQIVEITAKGGYAPSVSTVKAGVPTIIRFNTKGTFDCSSSVRIPSMNISRSLPASGVTEVALGVLEPGVLDGTCGMGMYPFQLDVKS